MKNKLLLLIILPVFISCEKESPNFIISDQEKQEVQPNEYLAAYPESWWKFSNGAERNCELDEFPFYELKSIDQDEQIRYIDRTRLIIPKITGYRGGVIYKNAIVFNTGPFKTEKRKQVSTVLNSGWIEFEQSTAPSDPAWSTYRPTREVIALHDSIVLPNDLIFYDVVEILVKHNYESKIGPYQLDEDKLFYAKEIGLIREINFHFLEVVGDSYLEEYYIAPH